MSRGIDFMLRGVFQGRTSMDWQGADSGESEYCSKVGTDQRKKLDRDASSGVLVIIGTFDCTRLLFSSAIKPMIQDGISRQREEDTREKKKGEM